MGGVYYKFLSDPAALQYILRGHVKITPPRNLNDPSELAPNFSIYSVRRSLEDIRRRGHSAEEFRDLIKQGNLMRVLAPEFQAIPTPRSTIEADEQIRRPFYNNSEFLEKAFSRMVQTISTRVGVFCLTQRIQSLPMWVHYADRARGILVEFRDLACCFPGDSTGVLNEIKGVNYREELDGVTFYPGSYGNIFFEKFKDWEYEAEFRVVVPLDNCGRVDVNGEIIFTSTVPVSVISSVVIGWRASEETKRAVEIIANTARRNGWPGDVYMSQFRNGTVTWH